MKLSQEQQIFTQDIAKLILKANSLNINLTFGEAHRTEDQQQLYYFGKTVCNNNGEISVRLFVQFNNSELTSAELRKLCKKSFPSKPFSLIEPSRLVPYFFMYFLRSELISDGSSCRCFSR